MTMIPAADVTRHEEVTFSHGQLTVAATIYGDRPAFNQFTSLAVDVDARTSIESFLAVADAIRRELVLRNPPKVPAS